VLEQKIKNMEYNVGDKVRIKSLYWYNENKDEDGDVPCDCNILFLNRMKKYCGKVMTINTVYNCTGHYEGKHIYAMEGVKNIDWTEDMIESKVEEIGEFDPQKVNYRNTNTVSFKSKRWADKNKSDEYQKGYQEAVANIIKWLKEHDMTQHISILYAGVCAVNFNVDELISQFNEAMGK
jgi:hypothetical protein